MSIIKLIKLGFSVMLAVAVLTRGDELRSVKLEDFNALLRDRFAKALEHSVTVVARGTAAK